MPAVDLAASAEAAIARGQRHCVAGAYREGLKEFTTVVRSCPCTRGKKRTKCGCKDFDKVISTNGSIYEEAMFKCKCQVSKLFDKCDVSYHLEALYYRARALEMMKQFKDAKMDAEWLLELAPSRPEGYLCLAKYYRLKKKFKFAAKVYDAGIETSKTCPESERTKALFKGKATLAGTYRDPLALPAELAHQILCHLDVYDLVRCLRVCAGWSKTLIDPYHAPVWRELTFSARRKKNPAVIPLKSMKKLLLNSRNTTQSITIANARAFQLNDLKMCLLLAGAEHLQHLRLGYCEVPFSLDRLGNNHHRVCRKLESLTVSSPFPRTGAKDALSRLLVHNAASQLQYLDLNDIPDQWRLSSPSEKGAQMPRLKFLRLSNTASATEYMRLNLSTLAHVAPNIEQLSFQDIDFAITGGSRVDHFLSKLRVLVLQFTDLFDHRMTIPGNISWLLSMNRAKSLEHVVLSTPSSLGEHAAGNTSFSETQPLYYDPSDQDPLDGWDNDHGKLQSLTLARVVLAPEKLALTLRDCISSQSLHSLDIEFPIDDYNSPLGNSSIQHLSQYAFLRGVASIRHLGLFEFQFKDFARDDADWPLADFLASFPNLESLDIASTHYTGAESSLCAVIETIIQKTKLKTLYVSGLFGVVAQRLQNLVTRCGIDLRKGRRPTPWPVPLVGEA